MYAVIFFLLKGPTYSPGRWKIEFVQKHLRNTAENKGVLSNCNCFQNLPVPVLLLVERLVLVSVALVVHVVAKVVDGVHVGVVHGIAAAVGRRSKGGGRRRRGGEEGEGEK